MLKGHQNAARRVEFISAQKRSVILAPLSGRILDGGYPGLKPWAEILSPFRGEMLARSLKLTPMKFRLRFQTTNCWTFPATKAHLGGILPLNRWAILNIKQTASISDRYLLAPPAYEPC
jgi:hypothetical protein